MHECLTCDDLELLRLAKTGGAACPENYASDIVRMTGHSLILIDDLEWR
jgi:hypothetical protein